MNFRKYFKKLATAVAVLALLFGAVAVVAPQAAMAGQNYGLATNEEVGCLVGYRLVYQQHCSSILHDIWESYATSYADVAQLPAGDSYNDIYQFYTVMFDYGVAVTTSNVITGNAYNVSGRAVSAEVSDDQTPCSGIIGAAVLYDVTRGRAADINEKNAC